jgi:uncharacterized SAM-binding protein YcdF (DUF218 family)
MPEGPVATKPAPPVDVPRKRSQWIKPLVVLLAVCAVIIAALYLLSRAGAFLVIHAPQRSEVMVVLEGGLGSSRFEQALRLRRAGYAPRILVDADVTRDFYGKSEADMLFDFLRRTRLQGIEVCPTVADSTFSEVADVERCMKAAGATSAIIVTSDFHTRRALSIFRKRLPQHQWSVAASSWPGNAAEQYWKHRWWAKSVLDEWEKYAWWQTVDRWRSDVVLK